jgi:hypothetical protein
MEPEDQKIFDANKNTLVTNAALPYAFQVDDIAIGFIDDNQNIDKILEIIRQDDSFIGAYDDGVPVFIFKNTLYRWFILLNIRLALCKISNLSKKQLLYKINGLRLQGSWIKLPSEFIKFGYNLGLINFHWKEDIYEFPLAYALSFLTENKIYSAQNYILDRLYLNNYSLDFEDIILFTLRDKIDELNEIQRLIITRREGILGERHLTLEELGQLLNRTRERIRQIQEKVWKKLRHPTNHKTFLSLLLIYLLNRKGSLIINSKIHAEIMFLLKYFNIPVSEFSGTNIQIIGDDWFNKLSLDIWKNTFCKDNYMESLISSNASILIENDLKIITDEIYLRTKEKLTIGQKVFLALKQIGKPAHFSEVKSVLLDIFPEEHSSDHSIHAILCRETNGIVWVGAKGTYALEEWGYEHPKDTLMNTIVNIVQDQYTLTGKPVPFIVIQAEIGKYRKLINKESIVMATFLNSGLKHIGNWCFIPEEQASEEIEFCDTISDELDQILREFENKYNS